MRNGLDLNDLEAFVAVAEAGGFTAAADRLGTAKSRISQRVGRLEDALGTTLFTRTTRRVSPTPEGEALRERCAPLLGGLTQAIEEAGQASSELHGPLRVAAPTDLAVQTLAPLVRRFRADHPGVRFELRSSDRILDPVQEGIDLSFRLGWLKDSTQRASKLRDFEQWVVASPAYLARAGTPESPEDLVDHDWLALSLLPAPLTWTFEHADGRRVQVQMHSGLSTDSTPLLRTLLLDAGGISAIDELSAAPALAAGTLVRVLPEWRLPRGGLYAVYPPRRFASARARAFVAFCRTALAD